MLSLGKKRFFVHVSCYLYLTPIGVVYKVVVSLLKEEKKLSTVCLSSAEVEYAACIEAAKETFCHRRFAKELHLSYDKPTHDSIFRFPIYNRAYIESRVSLSDKTF